jgi:15-cis-phytoene synthase
MSITFQNPHFRYCGEQVAVFDPDRHIASLFAPADRRPHLAALHAFALEIGKVRASVSEAMPGEIRLQWWREVLEGERRGEAEANPVSAALLLTIEETSLPVKPLLDLIDARVFDLYDDLLPDWTTLEGYLGETQSSLIQLASMVLLRGPDPGTAVAAGHAGVAIGLTGLLRAFPWHARRGQVFLPVSVMSAVGLTRDGIVAGKDTEPLRAALGEMRTRARDHAGKARLALADINPDARPAFLPLVLVESYLSAMERGNYNPFIDIIEVPHWKRIWRIWRASRSF